MMINNLSNALLITTKASYISLGLPNLEPKVNSSYHFIQMVFKGGKKNRDFINHPRLLYGKIGYISPKFLFPLGSSQVSFQKNKPKFSGMKAIKGRRSFEGKKRNESRFLNQRLQKGFVIRALINKQMTVWLNEKRETS